MSNPGAKYWDLFEMRIGETIDSLLKNELPNLRRLSLHITSACNLKCSYCNEERSPKSLDRRLFSELVREYHEMGGGILHITGGEPSCVPWLYSDIARLGRMFPSVQFHLNTNLVTFIPMETLRYIKRLKVSLDSHDAGYFDSLVGIQGSFYSVLTNLRRINKLPEDIRPITSITYTMTRENLDHIVPFLKMYYNELPNLYAAFFSAYKGTNERFVFTEESIDHLFNDIKPELDFLFEAHEDGESKFLFNASHDKTTFTAGVRFEDNRHVPCYLQLSELVVNEYGDVANCSHLYRDGTSHTGDNIADWPLESVFRRAKKFSVHKVMSGKCLYGCNKKLVTFNKSVLNSLPDETYKIDACN